MADGENRPLDMAICGGHKYKAKIVQPGGESYAPEILSVVDEKTRAVVNMESRVKRTGPDLHSSHTEQ